MEATHLPPKEDFFSKLNNEHITDEDYKHAQEVWKKFGCKRWHSTTIFTSVYVLTLADVFQNFRKVCMKN